MSGAGTNTLQAALQRVDAVQRYWLTHDGPGRWAALDAALANVRRVQQAGPPYPDLEDACPSCRHPLGLHDHGADGGISAPGEGACSLTICRCEAFA